MDNYSEFISEGGVTLRSPRSNPNSNEEKITIDEQNTEDVHKLDKTIFDGRYPGYTYLDNYVYDNEGNVIRHKRIFYYDGIRIRRSNIPKNSFEYMRGVKMGYERTWEEYIKYNKYHSLGSKIPEYTNLLNSLNIRSRKDWKKWLLQNRLDKNTNIDILLVGMVNNSVEMRFSD